MKNAIVIHILLAFTTTANAQKTFAIWSSPAPGFPADPALANGTSVIICPGGSFCYLHTKTEGSDVVEWLNKKGVSADGKQALHYTRQHARDFGISPDRTFHSIMP